MENGEGKGIRKGKVGEGKEGEGWPPIGESGSASGERHAKQFVTGDSSISIWYRSQNASASYTPGTAPFLGLDRWRSPARLLLWLSVLQHDSLKIYDLVATDSRGFIDFTEQPRRHRGCLLHPSIPPPFG